MNNCNSHSTNNHHQHLLHFSCHWGIRSYKSLVSLHFIMSAWEHRRQCPRLLWGWRKWLRGVGAWGETWKENSINRHQDQLKKAWGNPPHGGSRKIPRSNLANKDSIGVDQMSVRSPQINLKQLAVWLSSGPKDLQVDLDEKRTGQTPAEISPSPALPRFPELSPGS